MACGGASCDNGAVRRSCWWPGWVALLWWSSPASAEPQQLWVGGGLGQLTLERPPYQSSAAALHVGARYEVNDQFWLLGELTSTSPSLRQPAPSPCPAPPAPCEETTFPYPTHHLLLATGVVYTLDVTRLTPYGGLLLGASRLTAGEGRFGALAGQKGQELRLGLVLAAGADYRLTARWSAGIGLRSHLLGGGVGATHYLGQVQWRF